MRREGPRPDLEIEIAVKWMRLARLLHLSFQAQSAGHLKHHIDRFSVLTTLLDDSVVKGLFEAGEATAARALRKECRNRYSKLICDFEKETEEKWNQCLIEMEGRGVWDGYRREFRRRCTWLSVSALLRGALVLHTLHAPGACAIARLATRYIRECLPPPRAKVIPIRAS
jgi:hypothetical protein